MRSVFFSITVTGTHSYCCILKGLTVVAIEICWLRTRNEEFFENTKKITAELAEV
jgi:hypothetical protein